MQHAIWRWARLCIFAIVGLFAFAAISSGLFLMWERHRLAEFNRTHERPLLVDPDDPVLADAHATMAGLKPLSRSDSLRFAVMPSYGKRWFAVSVASSNGRGAVEVVVTTQRGAVLRHLTFAVPKPDVERFLRQWDEITDDYAGEGRSFSDGTPLVFERRRGSRVTSGEGNSPCHYDVLGDLAARTFAAYVPELDDLRDPTLSATLKGKFCNRSIFELS